MLHPVATRVGTFAAGVIASQMALSPEQYATVENAIVTLMLFAIDMITRRVKV